MPATESAALIESRRVMEICNACRYCEGYCAVFPAMELRREFSAGDLTYLANLCHNCRGCYYACQYAPPHEFAVNVPRSFAELRAESYAEAAWPAPLAAAFARNGTVVALVTALAIATALVLTMALRPAGIIFAPHVGPGAFYTVIPWGVMVAFASASFGFALLALAVGTGRFWLASGGGGIGGVASAAEALGDVLTLRNLGGGGHGCNDRDGRFTAWRRWLHHAMFYGFLLCFAATSIATLYADVLGVDAPYAFSSLPVLLGTAGGVLLAIGTGGLIWVKATSDPVPGAPGLAGADYALLSLLLLAALSGLLLLAFRASAAMGVLLSMHTGLVLALFVVLPYSKFVHGPYRAASLLRWANERRQAIRRERAD